MSAPNRPRHATMPRRLIDISGHELRGVGMRVMGIKVLAVHEQVERRRDDFARLHASQLVAGIEHRVLSPAAGAGLWRIWTVGRDRLDLQKNIPTCRATFHSPTPCAVINV